jgi:6-pyruvoyltetrahydropterin/6-carboxytetrahydropterin synthase
MFVSRLATVEILKDELKFSSGHFMCLSADQRETMHGHDYQVNVVFDCLVGNNGMAFDLRFYKQRVLDLCQVLDYHFILPANSQFLKLEETENHWLAHTRIETLTFNKNDVVVLPITNVTLEELSFWFLQQLMRNTQELQEHMIQALTINVSNGRGQLGSSCWREETRLTRARNSFQVETL